MFNMHPGEFLNLSYVQGRQLSLEDIAARMNLPAETLHALVCESIRVTPELAVRLEAVLGRSAESWLSLQQGYDLFLARQALRRDELRPYDFVARYKLTREELEADMPTA